MLVIAREERERDHCFLYVDSSSDIMDLDVKGMQESLEQLKLSEKPRLSLKARQRLSVKSRKQALTATKSSPLTERKERREKMIGSTRSASPPGQARERDDGEYHSYL